MRRTDVVRAERSLTVPEYLEERPPLASRIDVAKRLLTAVARLHEAGLTHGRIDASSFMLHGARSFRAELRSNEAPVSRVRARGAPPADEEIDPREDVRALGVVLTTLLDDAALPATVTNVLAAMTDEQPQRRYANALIAMCAFARVAP